MSAGGNLDEVVLGLGVTLNFGETLNFSIFSGERQGADEDPQSLKSCQFNPSIYNERPRKLTPAKVKNTGVRKKL